MIPAYSLEVSKEVQNTMEVSHYGSTVDSLECEPEQVPGKTLIADALNEEKDAANRSADLQTHKLKCQVCEDTIYGVAITNGTKAMLSDETAKFYKNLNGKPATACKGKKKHIPVWAYQQGQTPENRQNRTPIEVSRHVTTIYRKTPNRHHETYGGSVLGE